MRRKSRCEEYALFVSVGGGVKDRVEVCASCFVNVQGKSITWCSVFIQGVH